MKMLLINIYLIIVFINVSFMIFNEELLLQCMLLFFFLLFYLVLKLQVKTFIIFKIFKTFLVFKLCLDYNYNYIIIYNDLLLIIKSYISKSIEKFTYKFYKIPKNFLNQRESIK